MNILGINCFQHDSSATLLQNGRVLAAIEEERLNRTKHSGEFPGLAITRCFEIARIKSKDVQYFGYYMKPWIKIFKMGFLHSLRYFPKTKSFFGGQLTLSLRMFLLTRKLRRFLGVFIPKSRIIYVQHHLAHAASAYFTSSFDESAILSIDGAGEYSTALLAYGSGNNIKKISEVNFPHSLGLLYSAVTRYLGFEPNEDEYKIMGLAPYGKPKYYEKLKRIVSLERRGRFRIALDFFQYHYDLDGMSVSPKFLKLFGPARGKEEAVDGRFADMAASVQKLLEDTALDMARYLFKVTKSNNLCLAGGVALNCAMNGSLLRDGPFKNIFVQPAASDSGTSLGAALYIHHCLLGNTGKSPLESVFWGPEYSDNQIERMLLENKLRFVYHRNIEEVTAGLLSKGNVVGWFQGRMEFGPRALGCRSILADPRKEEMKDIVNKRIKHREPFRPFAPSVLEESASEYFEGCKKSPFMTIVYPVKEAKKSIIPAVTHVDGTSRVQTVSKEFNPKYWGLIRAFEKITGVPVVLNTSFNVKGEPIVCSPEEALRCFYSTGLDHLVLGNYLVEK